MRRTAASLAKGGAVMVASLIISLPPAAASYQTCAEKFVSMDTVRCPDGSVPHYAAGQLPGAPSASARSGATTTPADTLFGIWHTNRPGAAYASALDVPGAYALAARPGLAQGDLTISPNGTYAWNSFSGTAGRWLRGANKTIMLYDEANHTKWMVTPGADRIAISNEKQSFTGKR